MVSVCLPSDALLQHLPSYLGFSYLGRGVSLFGYSSKVQPLPLTVEEGYLLTAAPPDLEHSRSGGCAVQEGQEELLQFKVIRGGHEEILCQQRSF